jgi:hypothetical protein
MSEAIASRLGFLTGAAKCIRCPGCRRMVDLTRDDYLAGHTRLGTRKRCDRSGMAASIIRAAVADRT